MKLASYSNIGKRANNEDSIAIGKSVVVLCDGVGGINKGEVASSFVASKIVEKTLGLEKNFISAELVQVIVRDTQLEIIKTIENHPENFGMGTTLCAVFFAENEVLLTHIGDSRIYYVKPDEKKYWRTTDHSTVAELVQTGFIKEEEARTHFLSNQITRAIQANPEIKPALADITSVKKTEPGDLIFICSDGVMESFTDIDILELLTDKSLTIKTKINLIESKCLFSSSDNNSAVLLEFEKDDERISNSETELNWISYPAKELNQKENFDVNSSAEKPAKKTESTDDRTNPLNRIIKIALFTFAVLFIAFLTMTLFKNILA